MAKRKTADLAGGTTKLTYSVPEAGALIGLSRNAAYEAAARGDLPILKIGGRIFVPRAALHQMLEAVGADHRRK